MAGGAAFLLASLLAGSALGRARRGIRRDEPTCRLGQDGVVAGQTALQDLTGIVEQMKAVGDLFGLGRS